MECYVCGKEATKIRTGNVVCEFHASEEGFKDLEEKAQKDTFGDNPYLGDYTNV